jgi:hypothetical protein
MKMKNRIFAIPAAAAAIPVNPKIAATIQMMKKSSAYLSISVVPEGRC